MPPVEVRELRALLSHRRRLVSQQTTLKNRLQSVLPRLNVAPQGELFAKQQRSCWGRLALSARQRLRLDHDLIRLEHVTRQIADVDGELRRLSTSAPWAAQVLYLLQVPGIGLLTAMTILVAVGDVMRFGSAKQLVGYAGMGAGVHASGTTHRDKGITKQGQRDLRYVMVEAARSAVLSHPEWKRDYRRLAARHPGVPWEPKAVVAGRAEVAGGGVARLGEPAGGSASGCPRRSSWRSG